eukprot:scaffold9819_cov21-Tisochrysis_lutea.AAC.1
MLQHRGQDSAGMVTTNWEKFKEYKENGLVKDVFSSQSLMDSMIGEQGGRRARIRQRANPSQMMRSAVRPHLRCSSFLLLFGYAAQFNLYFCSSSRNIYICIIIDKLQLRLYMYTSVHVPSPPVCIPLP